MHPIRRFKRKIRIVQFGRFTNVRDGNPAYGEPKQVLYEDFRYFVRLFPNFGYRLPGIKLMRHRCRNEACTLPRKQRKPAKA